MATQSTEQLLQELVNMQKQMMRGMGGASLKQDARTPAASKQSNSDGKDTSFKALKKANEELIKAQKAYTASTYLRTKDNNDTKSREELQKASDEYAKAIKNQTGYLTAYSRELNKYTYKSFGEQLYATRELTDVTSTFSSKLAKSQLASSLLTASLVSASDIFQQGSAEYDLYVSKLGKATEGLDKSILEAAGVWDETTKGIKENLRPDDFKDLRLKMGEAQTTISETFAGLEKFGFKDAAGLQSVIDSGSLKEGGGVAQDALTEELRALTKTLVEKNQGSALGIKGTGENGEISDVDIEKFAANTLVAVKALEDFNNRVGSSAKALDTVAVTANTTAGKALVQLQAKFGTLNAGLGTLAKHIATDAAIIANAHKTKDALVEGYKQLTDFNIAQVPASFGDVTIASMKMGMSFEDTVKFMQENKRTMAIYGAGFGKLTGQMSGTFAKFGYNMKQAGEMVGPAIESGITAGIDVSNGDALNKFIDSSMESFKDISGIVDMTAKDYLKLNATLLDSQEIAGTMLGMDKQRSQAYAQDLIALRNHYIQTGLSAQQAQELVQTQKAQQREKVGSKYKDAAMGMAQMQATGASSEDATRYFQLMTNGNRSKEQDEELQGLAQKKVQAAESARQNAYDNNNAAGTGVDVLLQATQSSGGAAKMDELALKQLQAKKAGTDLSGEGDTRARDAGEAAKGKEGVAILGNIVNSVSSALTNVFSVAAIGAAASLGGLAFQANMARTALGGKGGIFSMLGDMGKGMGGKAGGIMGKIGGIFGGSAGGIAEDIAGGAAKSGGGLMSGVGGFMKGGGLNLLKGAGMGLLKGGIGGLAGIGADMAGDALKESGHEKLGGLASAAGDAATGAAIGSIIPGVGTVIGGAIGGAYGLYKNRNEILGPSEITPPPPTVNKSSDSGSINTTSTSDTLNTDGTPKILSVSDVDAKTQLLSIAENMASAVGILQKISESGLGGQSAPVVQSAGRQIPTAYAYQTGIKA
jgi:hypothetical protein